MHESGREPIHNQYFGEPTKEARSVFDYRKEILAFANRNIYTLVLDVAETASWEGQKEIIIFEFGSGREAIFASQLLGFGWLGKFNPLMKELVGEFERFQRKLAELKIGIKYLGITDAKSADEHKKVLLRRQEGNFTLENYAYTVARSQTIKDFLEDKVGKGENCVDLALAVHSLCYLTPQNFKEAVLNLLESLREGGVLVALNLNPYFFYKRKGFENMDREELRKTIKKLIERYNPDRYKFLESLDGFDFEINTQANLINSFVAVRKRT